MLNYWNKNTQLDVIVLDLSKAFDTVPHDRLLGKLDHYGINGHIHSWISNFLKHGSQCVLVDGAESDPAHVVSDVPQGTVMGPLLFLLHINELPEMSPLRSGCLQMTVSCTDLSTMLVINLHCSVIWTLWSSGVTNRE